MKYFKRVLTRSSSRGRVWFAPTLCAVAACFLACWLGTSYRSELQVAKELESRGVKVHWRVLWISSVTLNQLDSSDELATVCARLERLRGLDCVYVNHSSLTDEDLRLFSRLATVSEFDFFDVPIEGSGLKHLRKIGGG